MREDQKISKEIKKSNISMGMSTKPIKHETSSGSTYGLARLMGGPPQQ